MVNPEVRRSVLHSAILVVAFGVTACAPSSAEPSQGRGADAPASAPGPIRTMVISTRTEPAALARKPLSRTGTSSTTAGRIFNATLGIFDGQGSSHPYLAEALPRPDTDTWRVFPDGRMETTFRLRPNLTWHDGTALSADDFVFAWQVYASPQIPISAEAPQNLIEEVVAPDSATVVIRWRRPYPNAGVLQADDFPPLPRHILQSTFLSDPEALVTLPYWTREYVGLGPFRLARWEPGSFIEGIAFEGHSLGRPKIDRMRVAFIGDTNAALANLLSGDVQFATDSSIRFQQALTLRREWGPTSAGTVLTTSDSWRGVWTQLRPQYVSPRALLDARVRRALAHAVNKQALNDASFEGQGVMSEAPLIPPGVAYYAEVDRAIARYPYDPRAAERLMTDAGFAKGTDGFFAGASDGKLHFEVKTLAASEREAEMAVLGDTWRRTGFDFSEVVLPATQSSNNEARNTFQSLFAYSTGSGEYSLAAFTSTAIGSPENRWIGANRAGWVNDEFDRLSAAFADSVATADRVRYVAEMARVFMADVPAIPIQFDVRVHAFPSTLRGPQPAVQEDSIPWNVYDWELS